MAGTINDPSVIWVAGETEGYTGNGELVTISGYLPPNMSDMVLQSAAYTDAAVAVLEARLVASGIL